MKSVKNFLILLPFFVFFINPSFCFATQTISNYSLEKIFYISQNNIVDGVLSLEKNWQKIDIVAPQMYSVTPELKLTGKIDPSLKKVINDYNLKTMPLVTNGAFKRDIMHNLLVSKTDQNNIIAGMIEVAKKNKFIGWQFDFENIDYKDKDLFSEFVEKTYTQFKKNKLILSIAAVARYVDFEDTAAFRDWSGVYDYKRIAKSSDFISLMTYDDPNSKGPVASKEFVNKCLVYIKDKVPADKLSLGIPLYYWKWDMESSKRMGSGMYKSIMTMMANFKHTLGFDNELGAAWLSYFFNDKNYAVWFENKQSFEQKLKITKDNKLRGFSAWVLGGEDPAIWSALSNTLKK